MPNSDLIDFTLCNARRFYSSKGDLLEVKGLSIHAQVGGGGEERKKWERLMWSEKACTMVPK